MAADYFTAVCIRYGLLLAAGGIARSWVLPDAWSVAVAVAVLVFGLLVIHTEPAARYARGLRDPWYGWMMLSAACAHAFGAAAVYALAPLTEPRFTRPDVGGIQFENPWVNEPSLLEVGSWIVAYAVLSAAWALLAGGASRALWGVLPPDPHRVRIRRRAGAGPDRIAEG